MNLFKSKHRESDPDDEDSIEGERALASVNKGLTIQNRITNWAVVIGICALTGALLYKYYAGMYRDYGDKSAPVKDVSRTVATTSLPPLRMPIPEPATPEPAPMAAGSLPPLQQASMSSPAGAGAPPAQSAAKGQAELVRDRRLKHELRFNLDGADAGSRPAGTASAPAAAIVEESRNASAVQASSFSAARAYIVPHPSLVMTRGQVIPCTVIPAIDTTLTGIVTCITTEDATGTDNRVSLMDRGTICVGQQGGGVTHGQRRVGIIWQRCETPQHVLVPLDSGATDALGRPGIPGDVDNHFWDRFGGAIALSLVSDIGPYLVASRQTGGNNNTTIAFPNVLNGPQELMAEVLKSTMDIRPTIAAPQGARVLIYLAGDIDFRDVYRLERR
jgi:type IV secretion system protein VirB10